MARLPVPGSDGGVWGSVLNEFLSEAHNPDGTIKSAAIAHKADNAAVVHSNGSETVNGIKTFSSSPIAPLPTTSSQVATKQYVDEAARRADWIDSLFEESLRPYNEWSTPTVQWSSGMTTALSSPVEYTPVVTNTGAQVTNWNGLAGPVDPHFLWSPGRFYTQNGGLNDLTLHAHDKSGVAGYPWPLIAEFTTSVGVNVIELAFYDTTNFVNYLFLEVEGRPVCPNVFHVDPIAITPDMKLTITFPDARSRRIRMWLPTRLAAVRVPNGCSITKPTDPIRRRYAVCGDSFVNGSSDSYAWGAAPYETHGALLLRALKAQQPVLAGVGQTGFIAGQNYQTRASDLASFDLDGIFVYGSVNDSQDGVGVQAACETFLATLGDVPLKVVVGCVRSGWNGAYNSALQAAAAAANVQYIDMSNFITGDGSIYDMQSGGNAGWFIGGDGVHPTTAAHHAIAKRVFSEVVPRIVA